MVYMIKAYVMYLYYSSKQNLMMMELVKQKLKRKLSLEKMRFVIYIVKVYTILGCW